jgi:hypothetical protein
MDQEFLVIYDDQDFDHYVTHSFRTVPHTIRAVGGNHTFRRQASPEDSDYGQIVTYWNTDLNDYGRKNDLRESVKNFANAHPELSERLKLPFDSQTGAFLRLAELNEVLGRVVLAGEGPDGVQDKFEITTFKCLPTETTIRVRRGERDSGPPQDHLSAGENESFFIFSLALGLPLHGSIVLLDEPDLHLAVLAKAPFYRALYALAENATLVVATHTPFAIKAEWRDRIEPLHLSSTDRRGSQEVVRVSWSKEFATALSDRYLDVAVTTLSVAGPLGRRCGWISGLVVAGLKAAGVRGQLAAVVMFLMVIGTLLLVGAVNDFVLRAIGQAADTHAVWAASGAVGFFVLLFLAIFLFGAYLWQWVQRR